MFPPMPRPPCARVPFASALLLALAFGSGGARASAQTLTAPPPAAAGLAAVLDSITSTPPLHRAHWGVEVREAGGVVWATLNSERHFIPASNQKLLVTAAALAELGPEYRYRTPVLATGSPGDTVVDQLLVLGRGDPTLSARFHPSDLAPLDSLADSVALAGIRRIANLVIDASWFAREPVHPSWEVGDLDWYYAAPVAAFGIAEGAVAVQVAPGPVGGLAEVRVLEPAGPVVVLNRTTTVPAGAEGEERLHRVPGTDTLVLGSTIPADSDLDTLWVTPLDPALHAGISLTTALEVKGVAVGRMSVRYREPAAEGELLGTEVGGRRSVAAWTSPPLAEIVAAVLKPSQNWIAETLLKTLGRERGEEGDWEEGTAVVERFLADSVGLDTTSVVIRDGSGLSAQNLVTPAALVQLLEYARTRPWGPAYRAAMAEPGRKGTLSSRLRAYAGRLHAKTGTIANVSSLSGYLTTPAGRELSFSILTNGTGLPASQVRSAIDDLVHAMDGRR